MSDRRWMIRIEGVDLDPGRNLVSVEAKRLAPHDAPDPRDHRTDPQRFLDDRIEVFIVGLRGPAK
jgi:hypothetical protein